MKDDSEQGMDDLSPEDIEFLKQQSPEETAKLLSGSNAGYWAEFHQLKLQSGTFSFYNHEYLIELFTGPMNKKKRARKRCYMKAPQGGFSIVEAIINLWGMSTKYYKQGVLHLLPTKATVEEFGKAKYGTIISKNKNAIGRYVKSGTKGVDSASMKQIFDAFLYLRSATLRTDDEGDNKSAAGLASISVDKVDFDEIEMMDLEAIALALGRMDHSDIKEEVYIGNPGGEDSGIDLVWKGSDMRHWYRKCTCMTGDLHQWMSAEKEFPDCVREYPDADEREREGKHRGFIACKRCGKPLPVWSGRDTGMWVPDKPSIVDMEGYRWSHLSSAFHDPAEILRKFIDPPYGNLGGVYRMHLGLPYSAAEDKLRKNVILGNCCSELMKMSSPGPCIAGMDVGLIKHLVIGMKTAPEKIEIVRVAKPTSFDEAYDLFRRYNVRSGVVDIRPYEDEARKFQKLCKKVGIKVYLCQYVDNSSVEYSFNDNTGIVKTYRTGIFDQSHRYFANGNITLPRQNSDIEEFAQQCCNCEKYPDKDRNGSDVMRYRPCGDTRQGEHFRNALNYLLLSTHKAAVVAKKGSTRQKMCIN